MKREKSRPPADWDPLEPCSTATCLHHHDCRYHSAEYRRRSLSQVPSRRSSSKPRPVPKTESDKDRAQRRQRAARGDKRGISIEPQHRLVENLEMLRSLVPQATKGECLLALDRCRHDARSSVTELVEILMQRAQRNSAARSLVEPSLMELFPHTTAASNLSTCGDFIRREAEIPDDCSTNRLCKPLRFVQFAPSGQKRGLIISIDYNGSDSALAGPHEDARRVASLLCDVYGFTKHPSMWRHMRDTADTIGTFLWPSKANIMRSIRWFRQGLKPGDVMVLYFSGHGGQQRCADDDFGESDGRDETILPVDHLVNGAVTDDELNAELVALIPRGALICPMC